MKTQTLVKRVTSEFWTGFTMGMALTAAFVALIRN